MATTPHNVSVPTRVTSRRGLQIGNLAFSVLTWIGAFLCLFPLAWTMVSSFRPDGRFLVAPFGVRVSELTLSNYATVFQTDAFAVGFRTSAIQVSIILASTLFFCPLAGYGYAKFNFPGKRILFGLMVLTLFFIPLTQYVPLLLEMNALGWVGTYQALVIPQIVSSLGIFWMTTTISAIPNELLYAARVDGCGNFGVWIRIIMPAIRPALVSLAVVGFLSAYNDYLWPLVIMPDPNRQTIQVALASLTSMLFNSALTSTSNWGAVLAGSTVVFLPAVIIFLFMQHYFVRGVLQGSLKG